MVFPLSLIAIQVALCFHASQDPLSIPNGKRKFEKSEVQFACVDPEDHAIWLRLKPSTGLDRYQIGRYHVEKEEVLSFDAANSPKYDPADCTSAEELGVFILLTKPVNDVSFALAAAGLRDVQSPSGSRIAYGTIKGTDIPRLAWLSCVRHVERPTHRNRSGLIPKGLEFASFDPSDNSLIARYGKLFKLRESDLLRRKSEGTGNIDSSLRNLQQPCRLVVLLGSTEKPVKQLEEVGMRVLCYDEEVHLAYGLIAPADVDTLSKLSFLQWAQRVPYANAE